MVVQMCSECDLHTDWGCSRTVALAEGKRNDVGSCSLSRMRSSSQMSAKNASSRSSTLALVYKRRKLHCPANAPSADIHANISAHKPNHVYQRRKLKKNPDPNFISPDSPCMPPNAKSAGACTSSVRTANLSLLATNRCSTSEAVGETDAVRTSSTSVINCSREPILMNCGTLDGCLSEEHGSDVKVRVSRVPELCSVDDSCSSSMLNVDLGSAPLKNVLDDTAECSSSGAPREIVEEELSEKVLCISILKSHGLLSICWPDGTSSSGEDVPSCSDSGSSLVCSACGHLETTKNMLICDHCEAAFHVPCCNPSIKRIPVDEWYCQSCCKRKPILMEETKLKKSPIIRSEASSRNGASVCKLDPIALMLKDTRPYASGVRIGKDFQADVPNWSGPLIMDADAFPEAVELDPSETISLPEVCSRKPSRSYTIGNWLQCREVIAGLGGTRDGTICGRWRRAPLFDVQTDNWDCFQSFLWDPTYADCAAPQELETDEVMKQLKYIELLRPRLAAKRHKMDSAGVDSASDAGKCADRLNVGRSN